MGWTHLKPPSFGNSREAGLCSYQQKTWLKLLCQNLGFKCRLQWQCWHSQNGSLKSLPGRYGIKDRPCWWVDVCKPLWTRAVVSTQNQMNTARMETEPTLTHRNSPLQLNSQVNCPEANECVLDIIRRPSNLQGKLFCTFRAPTSLNFFFSQAYNCLSNRQRTSWRSLAVTPCALENLTGNPVGVKRAASR